MDYYEALIHKAAPVEITPSETSYFSKPAALLDPRLFRGDKLIPSVRNAVLSVLYSALNNEFVGAESWSLVWLAGSGVSYHWAAHRDPADLDCLVGIDYGSFRQANPAYRQFSDKEIASTFNEKFREELHPATKNFMDSFELTFYVNAITDIKQLRPYAAYSLTSDEWEVEPVELSVTAPEEWENKASRDYEMAVDIVAKYKSALNSLHAAQNDAVRRNAEYAMGLAASQGSALFDAIHGGRSAAFSPSGQGYADYANYRWQAGKESGIIPALRQLKEISTSSRKATEMKLYGAELPTASTLIRRAATYNQR